ncbi:MAG TPA: glycosyltransferase family 4 protein [Candidatus Bathyarchaeia archaeon]|nr:glycosyltransferase family 4 protein [Candidatus Bathyarchaeia archaeon]
MKIALVAPSPVPFTIGGAENLAWGLVAALNRHTPHQAELIKLPSPEATFFEVVESYRRFSELDLSPFDLVISCKYPAWMVEHPRHVCYLLHRLRGLYDTYPAVAASDPRGASDGAPSDLQELGPLRRILDEPPSRGALVPLFDEIARLCERRDLPPELFRFPGPLARSVVRFLDAIGLSPGAQVKFCAISKTVADRPGYFPAGADVEVIHPPSHLSGFRSAAPEHLFTVSRLDGPKRIALLIDAMRHVRADLPLLIAGTGPDEDGLRRRAAGDPRIRFLGFVKDHELVDLYARSLAVPYVPYAEDYGLVTLEAMMSAKPVVTTSDSGGPTELVVDGTTGFSVAPEPAAIAGRIDALVAQPARAAEMGAAGRCAAESIRWDDVVARLLHGSEARTEPGPRVERASRMRTTASRDRSAPVARPAKRKVLVATTQPIYPPCNGGQLRLFNLFRNLGDRFEVECVSLCKPQETALDAPIAPGLREVRVPKSAEHERVEAALSRKVDFLPITDVALPLLHRLTPRYGEALARGAARASLIVASHPYALPALREATPASLPMVYEAHNVELLLKSDVLPRSELGAVLLELTRATEAACCVDSGLVSTCSEEDGAAFGRIYGVPPARRLIVPNGADVATVRYAGVAERRRAKRIAGYGDALVALFLASWHPPNLLAVERIFELARELPEVRFVVAGGVSLAFAGQTPPPNVKLEGTLDGEAKARLLGLADVALNPMTTGSGTNLKLLEYFAAGIPVISTPFGARGLAIEDGRHLWIREVQEFASALDAVRATPPALLDEMAHAVRRRVEERYDWRRIAADFAARLSALD